MNVLFNKFIKLLKLVIQCVSMNRQADRQRDRQTDGQTGRQTDRGTDRSTEITWIYY
jgi:hypothetical protein